MKMAFKLDYNCSEPKSIFLTDTSITDFGLIYSIHFINEDSVVKIISIKDISPHPSIYQEFKLTTIVDDYSENNISFEVQGYYNYKVLLGKKIINRGVCNIGN